MESGTIKFQSNRSCRHGFFWNGGSCRSLYNAVSRLRTSCRKTTKMSTTLAVLLVFCVTTASGNSTTTDNVMSSPATSAATTENVTSPPLTPAATTDSVTSPPVTTMETSASATPSATTTASTTTVPRTTTATATYFVNQTTCEPPVLGESEGVCKTRYLTSGASAQGSGMDEVGIAVVLQLRASQEGRGCGAVSGVDLQVAAALIWATKLLNGQIQNPPIGPYIPGVHLGVRIYDDCGHSMMAAHHIGEMFNVHEDYSCIPPSPPLAGVLGTSLSRTTTRVAELLADTKVPNFGISATLFSLSNSEQYPTFFRTVPSDLTQSQVLVDMVKKLGWNYVAGIYTKDNYGIQGFAEFRKLATMVGVCVYKEEKFSATDPNLEDDLEEFVREMLFDLKDTLSDNLGVVLFAHADVVLTMFHMIETRRSRWSSQHKLENLHWLSSDGVGTSAAIAKKVQAYQKSKVLSISQATVQLPDFRDFFFNVLDHPEQLGPYWQSLVHEYLTLELNCHQDPPTSGCRLRDKINLYDYVPAALDSMYSLAALLKRAHAQACASSVGSGIESGVCQNLAAALEAGLLSIVQPEYLNYSKVFDEERLPEQFRSDRMLVLDQYGDFVNGNSPLYFINMASGGKWTKIGEYGNGSISISPANALAGIPQSACGGECTICLVKDRISYVYYPGDHIILGLYPLREPGPADSFECSTLYRTQGATVAAFMAFTRTLQALNSKTGSGGGVTYPRIGGLLLDDCYNRLTASSLLVEFFSGAYTITDQNGETVDMNKVVAVVGSQSSGVTLSALSILTPLGRPTVSYSATSPDLDDRVSYPYFLRTVPSDTMQARALLDVVHAINATHVAVLHQDNNYGLRGMQKFVEMAEKEGVCVEEPYAIDAQTNGYIIRNKLIAIRNSNAGVVVVFLTEPTVLKVLDETMDDDLGLVFVASEAWGLGGKTLEHDRPKVSRGALVLTVDSTRQAEDVIVNMTDYLSHMTRPTVTEDPEWLRDFWEKQFECNLPGGFDNGYSKMCEADARLSSTAVNQLAGDQKVVQTINSVLSVATALRSLCGTESTCPPARNAETLTDAIRTVQLKDSNWRNFRPFMASGNGNVGFSVYNLQKAQTATGYKYVQVGRYDPESGLSIRREDIIFYDIAGKPISGIKSVCDPLARHCSHICGAGSSQTTAQPVVSTSSPQPPSPDQGLVAAVVVLMLLLLLLLALAVVVIICARRRRVPLKSFFLPRREAVNMTYNAITGSVTATPPSAGPGFNPFRADLPLPPIPRKSVTSIHQYSEPSDGTSNSHGSRSVSGQPDASLSSQPQTAFAEGVALSTGRSQLGTSFEGLHSDFSDSGSLPRAHGHTNKQRTPQQQHQKQEDLLRQLQERRRMEELWRVPDSPPLSPGQIAMTQERPRASSVSQAERPRFLTLKKSQDRMGGSEAGSVIGTPEQPFGTRPRSRSQDAVAELRMGPVSEVDRQLLFRYLASQQAQKQRDNPAAAGDARPAQTPTGDVRRSPRSDRGLPTNTRGQHIMTQGGGQMTPVWGQGTSPLSMAPASMSPMVNSPGDVFAPHSVVHQTLHNYPLSYPDTVSVSRGDVHVTSSPLSSSPRTCEGETWPVGTLSPPAGSPHHKYGSLMYLHPVATDAERNMYLQSFPVVNASPTQGTAGIPPGAFVVLPASMFQPPVAAVPQAAPGGPGYPSTPTSRSDTKLKNSSVNSSVSSPPVSTQSSSTSDTSGSVFLPHVNLPPHLAQRLPGRESAPEHHVNAGFLAGVASSSPGIPPGQAAELLAGRTPQPAVMTQGQVRTLSPLALKKLMKKQANAKARALGTSSPPNTAGVQGGNAVFSYPAAFAMPQDSPSPHSDSEHGSGNSVRGAEPMILPDGRTGPAVHGQILSDGLSREDPRLGHVVQFVDVEAHPSGVPPHQQPVPHGSPQLHRGMHHVAQMAHPPNISPHQQGPNPTLASFPQQQTALNNLSPKGQSVLNDLSAHHQNVPHELPAEHRNVPHELPVDHQNVPNDLTGYRSPCEDTDVSFQSQERIPSVIGSSDVNDRSHTPTNSPPGAAAFSNQQSASSKDSQTARISHNQDNRDLPRDGSQNQNYRDSPHQSAGDSDHGGTGNSLSPPNSRFPRDDSIPYIQGTQLVPVPSPCGPLSHHYSDQGSGNSNQTSEDSGNGEDLNTESNNNSDANMVAIGV